MTAAAFLRLAVKYVNTGSQINTTAEENELFSVSGHQTAGLFVGHNNMMLGIASGVGKLWPGGHMGPVQAK